MNGKHRHTGLSKRAWQFGLVLAAAALLLSCADSRRPETRPEPGRALELPLSFLPDLPELRPGDAAWRNEPPFTDKEVERFVKDVQLVRTMNPADTVAYLLRDRRWTVERLYYLDVKLALLVTALNTSSLETLSQAGPYYLPPTPEEIQAVQRFFPILNNLLLARTLAGG